MSRKDQSFDVPEPTIPQSSKKELPWFVCAAITTGLIAFCYEYSESLEDKSTSTSKGAQRVSNKITWIILVSSELWHGAQKIPTIMKILQKLLKITMKLKRINSQSFCINSFHAQRQSFQFCRISNRNTNVHKNLDNSCSCDKI